MPWTGKQHRLFEAVAHGWNPPEKSGINISREDATRMASEGVKSDDRKDKARIIRKGGK